MLHVLLRFGTDRLYPPTSYRLRQWSTIFRPGATFCLYISHLKKACQILNVPICWHDSLHDGRLRGGVENAQGSISCDNIATLQMLHQVAEFEGVQKTLQILRYLSFLCLLRAPSVGVCM